jgi:hypothetical protein
MFYPATYLLAYMKALITLTVLLAIIVLASQFTTAINEPVMYVNKVAPIDSWGNINYFVNRGFKSNLNITVESTVEDPFLVTVSLIDNCNTPASFNQETHYIKKGINNLIIGINVTPYAFVGLANLHILILDSENNLPIGSANIQMYIKVLGDFDNNHIVNSQDIAILSNAYTSYWENNAVSLQYQSCDITCDQKIDSKDLSAFSRAYNSYWSTFS